MAIRYVALLRGINVGGKNVIPMAALRESFVDLGATDVATYIQSGNVLFDGGGDRPAAWVERIEQALSERFAYHASVVLRSHREMRAVIAGAPQGFGNDPERFRSDVIFLKGPLGAKEVLNQVTVAEGVDAVSPGEGVVYFERLSARATQSRLNKVMGLPIYQQMTIRNWRTATTLLAMLDQSAARAGLPRP